MVRELDHQKTTVSRKTKEEGASRAKNWWLTTPIVTKRWNKMKANCSLDLDMKKCSLLQWIKELVSGKETESLQDFDVKDVREKGVRFANGET